jgi:hypothetical protein
MMARYASNQPAIFLVRAIQYDFELRHQMNLKKPVPALHSPLKSRKCLENVPWLARISLQSPLEAGNAFLYFLLRARKYHTEWCNT